MKHFNFLSKAKVLLLTAFMAAWGSSAFAQPGTAAPTPGALAAPKVISIFSDAFTSISGTTDFDPWWGQATDATIVDVAGNSTLKYANLNYQGTNFGSDVNATSMVFLHIDMWTSDETSVQVYPICRAASGNEPEKFVSLTPIVLNSWNSYNIPITDYTSQGLSMEDIYQFKFVGSGGKTIYLDNIYFWDNTATVDAEKPTAFTATKGAVTFSSVELLLKASDNSGAVNYEITYGATTLTTSGSSGVEKSYVINGLDASTDYSFSVKVKDATGNEALNSPITVTAKTAAPLPGAPTPPALDASKVISIFSGAYASIPGTTNFNPGWGQATVVSQVELSGNTTLKYANLNYQGTEFGSDVNAASMVYLHVDVYTTNETSLKIYPISRSTPEKFVSLTPLNLDTWNSYDIPLTDFTSQGLSVADIFQFKFVGSGGKTVYLDNLYFWDNKAPDTEAPTAFTATKGIVTYSSVDLELNATDNSGAVNYEIKYGATTLNTSGVSGTPKTYTVSGLTASTDYSFEVSAKDATGNTAANNPITVTATTLAPIPASPVPTFDAAKVISIFSNAYTDVVGTNFNPGWGQATVESKENMSSNDVLKYANLNYQGTEFGSHVDASNMTQLHVDAYTYNETSLQITIISPGHELLVPLTPLNTDSWNSYDIPLSSFTGVNLSDLFQLKVVGSGGKTVFLDNIYFYDNYANDLAAAKTAAAALTAEDYVDFSAVTAAVALPETDRAESVTKTNAINTAIAALVNIVNKNLADAKAAEALLVAADYNDYSAVTAALALPETNKDEKIAKTNALNTAMAALVNTVDDNLAKAKAAAAALTPSDYIDFTPVTNALSNPETTKGEKIVKTDNINLAIAGLVAKADDNLAKAKADEALLTSTDYVDYSAVTAALALPETNSAEKVTKTNAINAAIAALVTIVDNDLANAKAAEAALTAADYVDYSSVSDAMLLPETNNAEKIAKTDAINAAIAALVTKVDDNLATAKAAEALLTSTNYVDYSAVTTALALPETNNTEKVAKTNAINAAIAALVSVDSSLADAKTAAAALTAADYIDFSGVTAALALPETNSTEKIAKATAINTAITALVTVVDDNLAKAKTAEATLTASDYVSYSAVTTALALPETNKAEKIAKTNAINSAIAALVTVVDANLAAAKIAEEGLTSADYFSYTDVTNALALPESNSTEKIAKTNAINSAIAALVTVNDALATAKAAEAALTASDYYSYSAVTTALALPEATNSEKRAKTKAINNAIAALQTVDAALTAAKAAEAALTASDYYSYTAVTNALALPETNGTEKVAKTTAINNAIAGLLTVNAALAKAKADEALLVSTDYNSYTAVTDALALPEGTKAEKIAKTTAINNAIAGLEMLDSVVDANLAAAKAAEALLTSTDYVSYADVTSALALAEGTKNEKIAKTTAINNAIAALVSVVDINLAAAKDAAADLTASDYSNFSLVTSALALAETNKTEKVAKTNAINAAIAALVTVVDDNLAKAKAAEAALTASEYVSYSAVTAALALPESTKSEKVAKTNAINSAIAALVSAVDANLAAAKAAEAGLTATDYTSYAGVTAALALPESNKTEKIAKTNAINSAIAGLVSIVDDNLAKAKAAEALLKAADYINFASVTAAMALPETNNTEKVAKTNAINSAIAALITVVDDNLAKAKAAEAALTASDYVSYTAVTAALALPESNKTEKIAKTNAINSAIAGLVTIVNDNLAKAKTAEAALTAADYVSYTDVTAALALPETNNAEKIAKTNAINSAIAALVTVVDDNLAKAKAAEAALTTADYVSYTAVTSALALPESNKTEKIAKTNAINSAIAALVTVVDDNLAKVKAVEALLVAADYTSYAAVTAAKALPETNNTEKIAKTNALTSAIAALVSVVDDNLAKVKAVEAVLVAADYVDYSAVNAAKALPESTKAERIAKTNALTSAIAALVTVVDDNLAKAKAAEKLLIAAEYKDYSAVTAALALPETNNTEKVAKTNAINSAIAGLVKLDTGVDSNTIEQLSVYPNPSTGIVNVKCNAKSTITITDITGKNVLSVQSTDDLNTIDLTRCKKGLYCIKVSSNGRTSYSKVVLK